MASRTSHPFNSFEWIDSWWSVFSRDVDTLQIWTVWNGQQLLGALPMYRKRIGGLKHSCLFFVGTGEPRADEVATEYSDILALPNSEPEVAKMAIEWLMSFEHWARVDLRCLLQSSLLYQSLKQYAPLARRLDVAAGHRYRVPLAGDESELQLMGAANEKRIKRSLRAIERDGGLKRESASMADNGEKSLQRLIELNRQRQETKNRRSSFESDQFLRFHQSLFAKLKPLGQADIHSYFIKDELVATVYCFHDKQTSYYYQSGFAAQASNKYMPLTAAHLMEAAEARKAGRGYYDLMKAELPTYKAAMASDVEPIFNVYLFSAVHKLTNYKLMRMVRRGLVARLKSVGIERR